MIIISILLLQISYIFCLPSDAIMKAKDLEDLEKKAKALACNFLTTSSLLEFANKEKQIKDLLKKNKIYRKDSEANDQIQNFLTSICYSKMDSQTANEILIKVSEGHTEIPEKDKYKHFFDFDMKGDFKKYKKVMIEVNKVMKDIEAEEKTLHEQRKNDPELEKDIKDMERKLIKNKKYEENKENKEKDDKKKETKEEKRKNKIKKKREKKKNEEIEKEKQKQKEKEKEENYVPRRKREFSFKNFIGGIDLKTIWPFLISLLIILIFPFIFMPTNNNYIRNNKIMNREGEKQINKNKENEQNKENNKNEKKELNNNDGKNNKDNNDNNIMEKKIKRKLE